MTIQNIFKQIEEAKKEIENISVEQLKNEINSNPNMLLLDIREIQERIELGTIPNSTHCPRGMLEFWACPHSPYYRDYFQPTRRTVIYCAGGGRSVLATQALLQMGFTNVANLDLGFKGWQQAGETIEDVSKNSRWMRREKKSTDAVT